MIVKAMSHTLLRLHGCELNLEENILCAGSKKLSLPCCLTTFSEPYEFSAQMNLYHLLLESVQPSQPLITLMGCEQNISALTQKNWMVFGQEHGFIFQWFKTHRAIEAFNLLNFEKRLCIAIIIGNNELIYF